MRITINQPAEPGTKFGPTAFDGRIGPTGGDGTFDPPIDEGSVKPVRPINFLPAGWHPTWPPSNTDIARVEPGFDGDGNIVEISLVDGPKP